ncbi:cytochrome P450 [Lentzea jiangxiensis]|uniref:Cytochrome P450 n=1 Tax=Lentzea jiangxiensis TaxID=641025 RepID=A0A1H0X389_9PSEU|nr:cytochrome P450 [Lentzea jiangxiensis]SDP97401.1 hypothetical protein SAMN05421507_1314 [Lentzea jiangxiensis]
MDLLEDMHGYPGDLMRALLEAEVDGQRLTDEEITSFFLLLFTAGNEAVLYAIIHGLLAPKDFPDQLVLLQSDFDTYIAGAVEEIMRWPSPVVALGRTVIQTMMPGGVNIPWSSTGATKWSCHTARRTATSAWPADRGSSISPAHRTSTFSSTVADHTSASAHLARLDIKAMLKVLCDRLLPDLVLGEPLLCVSKPSSTRSGGCPLRIGVSA